MESKSLAIKNYVNSICTKVVIIIAKEFYKKNIWGINDQCALVLQKHHQISPLYTPAILIDLLILTEDRKYFYHRGTDFIAIIRAFIHNNIKGTKQGASTITQQYVRVLINDFELTVKRKIKEIFIALMLNDSLIKMEVAIKYLSIAYFGYKQVGLEQILIKNSFCKDKLTLLQASYIIARLKYPERKYFNEVINIKFIRRVNHIINNYNKIKLDLKNNRDLNSQLEVLEV